MPMTGQHWRTNQVKVRYNTYDRRQHGRTNQVKVRYHTYDRRQHVTDDAEVGHLLTISSINSSVSPTFPIFYGTCVE